MALLQHICENIYKILASSVILFALTSDILASESVRVLMPVEGDSLKITMEKGKIYSEEGDNVLCGESEESDEISSLMTAKDKKAAGKQKLIAEVESRKTFNLSLKDAIILPGTSLPGTNAKFNSLIFLNESSTIEINGRFIKGDLEVRLVTGSFKIINVVDIEDYLRHSISKEMNPNWPLEALKAQAVLARTYVLKKKYSSKNCLYDIGHTTTDQVYGTFSEDSLEVIQAVSGTAGEVLKYNGEIIDALYHSCCGGRTLPASKIFGFEKPYLVPVICSCGGECPYGKGWRYQIKAEKLKKILGLKNIDKICEENDKIRIKGDKTTLLTKNQFREKIGFNVLKSSDFSLSYKDGELTVSGKGFGHGVGLCQYGAKKMAEDGKGYREILFHYFKGVTIEKIY